MKRIVISLSVIGVVSVIFFKIYKNSRFGSDYQIGQPIDSLNHVKVYFNGDMNNNSGRNITPDHYNLGMKYQCVEFVKRYYYQHFNHRMPDSYGNAKDFFDQNLKDGEWNGKRELVQYQNGSSSIPQKDDIIIFKESLTNPFGHVAIVSDVAEDQIEIIQQNSGWIVKTRDFINLTKRNGRWWLENKRILGWLRRRG